MPVPGNIFSYLLGYIVYPNKHEKSPYLYNTVFHKTIYPNVKGYIWGLYACTLTNMQSRHAYFFFF